jgi:hypothetical protein
MESAGSMVGFLRDIGGRGPFKGARGLDRIADIGDWLGILLSPSIGDSWLLPCLFCTGLHIVYVSW